MLLDLTLPTPAENLALDEALLEAAEAGEGPAEVLRLWELPQPCVVIGRSSRLLTEVNEAACQQLQIPVLRRCSGGAAVVAGPGCLMYSVVLSYERHPSLHLLDQAHAFVLDTLVRALSTLAPGVERLGTSDLTRNRLKFSGNSLRCKRDFLLYHGTILYQFPLGLISRCLGVPPRQPQYRQGRSHERFVDNFPATRQELNAAITQAWSVCAVLDHWPAARVAQLVQQRYSQASWNERL